MLKRLLKATSLVAAAGLLGVAPTTAPAGAHHSFAIYTDAIDLGFVGVINSMIPEANHAILTFVVVNAERNGFVCRQQRDPDTGALSPVMRSDGRCEYVIWSMEITGAAGAANAGITLTTMPPGTVVSVGLNPERVSVPNNIGISGGDPGGGALFKGGGGGDGLGSVGRISVCPLNPDTGQYTLPPPGQYCNSLPGANIDFGGNSDGEIPADAFEWAAWAFDPTNVSGDVIRTDEPD